MENAALYPRLLARRSKSVLIGLSAVAVSLAAMSGVWVSPARAAGSGSASAQATSLGLSGGGNLGGLVPALDVVGATPRVSAPDAPGTASNSVGLTLSRQLANGSTNGVSATATRTSSGVSAQSHVDRAAVSGFGSSLLTVSDITSSVSCPASGSASAQTSANDVRAGNQPIDASAGGSANVPVALAGISNAVVTTQVSAPKTSGEKNASASGLLVTFTLHGTAVLGGTAVDVPLGSVTLAHSECTAPDGAGVPAGPSTGPTGSPAQPGGPVQPGDGANGPGAEQPSGGSTAPQTVPSPHVIVVVPDQGPTAGGQVVTINGMGFAPGAAVTFDGQPATAVSVDPSGTAITATTPAGSAGPADVRVVQEDQTAELPAGYTYLNPGAPTIETVSPSSGPIAGGQTVTITGQGFTPDTSARVDGTPLTDVRVLSSTALTAVTPAHAAGEVAVVLSNSHGDSGHRPYTYVDPASCSTGIRASSAAGFTGLGVGAAAILALVAFSAIRTLPRLRRPSTGG